MALVEALVEALVKSLVISTVPTLLECDQQITDDVMMMSDNSSLKK